MKTKTISKVIVYYTDGTYEEVKTGVSVAPHQSNPSDVTKTPVTPDFRPDWQKIQEWNPSMPYQPCWPPVDLSVPPWTVTCGTGSVPLAQQIDAKLTSTGNGPIDYKYTITSTGNGNVETSR